MAPAHQPYRNKRVTRTMTEPAPITIVNVGYLSTHYWVISAGTSRLLFDLGYPGTMGKMRANLDCMDTPLSQIRYAVASHYHIDHAGLAQELKLAGVPLLVLEEQVDAIPLMKRNTKPQDHYVEITTDDNLTIPCSESRNLLKGIGIPGEILHTPGHSVDSISLLLDSGEVFTGDLTPEAMAYGEYAFVVKSSWERLRAAGAKMIYPGHGPVRVV
jgi:ribonuclease/clavin/mitogillin